jgi:hypothetical protein
MVPIRTTATELGMGVEWDDATKTMTFTKGNMVITHVMGTNVLVINGEEKTYEAYSAVKNDTTYMPLIMLADVTGLEPTWEAKSKSVFLTVSSDDGNTDEEVLTDEDENEDDETEEVKSTPKRKATSDDLEMVKYLKVTYDTGKDMDGGKGQNYVYERTGGGYVVANLHNELYVQVLDKDMNVVGSNRFYSDDYEIGGYFFYNNYHYVLYGKDNIDSTNKNIVYKLVKYSTNFDTVKNVTVSGTNCRIDTPFRQGAAQIIVNGSTLTVSDTGTRMKENNKSLDCNIVMNFNIDDLSMLSYDITSEGNLDNSAQKNSGLGQKIAYIDDNSIACAALSDTRPRGLYLRATEVATDEEESEKVATLLKAAGKGEDKNIGIDIGGFETSDKYCIVAGTTIKQDNTGGDNKQKNVFVSTISKAEIEDRYANVYYITDYADGDDVNILYEKLVKMSNNLYLLIWQENRDDEDSVIKYVYLDGDGKSITTTNLSNDEGIVTIPGKLSSSQPLLSSDKKSIYFATTEEDGDPIELYKLTLQQPNIGK